MPTNPNSPWSFPAQTSGDLLFTNIVANEVDSGAGVQPFLPYPYAFGAPSFLGTDGLHWAAFSAGVTGTNDPAPIQLQLTLSYHVHATGSNVITGLDNYVNYDIFSGNFNATVTETITDNDGNVVASVTSSPTGDWVSFANFAMGYQDLNVTVTFNATLPANALPSDHVSISILSQGFAETPMSVLGSLGDYVWIDTNQNGVQDDGATGVAGVSVTLLDGDGDALATTTTDASGHYLFDHLLAGQYQVKFASVDGYQFTSKDSGADGADSDADTTTGATGLINLGAGEQNLTVDAGIFKTESNVPLAGLGDYVWVDTNGNGVQDDGTTGIAGVTVNLIGAGTNGQFGDSDDVVLGTTTTNGFGFYSFTGLTPGAYEVQFVAPSGGYIQTQGLQGGNTAIDSNAGAGGYTAPVTLAPAEFNETIDAGYYKLAALGDRVWLDADADGVQDAGENGISGVTVKLVGAGTDGTFGTGDDTVLGTTTTDGTGIYGFTGLMPGQYEVQFVAPSGGYTQTAAGKGGDTSKDSNAGTGGYTAPVTLTSGQTDLTIDAGYYKLAALGDRVWLDADADGVQDAGENGISGVTVKLIGAGTDGTFGTGDDTVLGTTTTDGTGIYGFTGLMPGQYEVQFVAPSGGYTQTAAGKGGDTSKDSNAGAGGYTAPVTLTSGQTDLTIDAGYYKLAALGDRVWLDADADGVQDAGENGISGVTVKLIGAGTDGTFGTGDDTVLGTTTTDGTGIYGFTGLMPGQYEVQFVAPSGGYTQTAAGKGGDTSKDSNAGAGGYTAPVTLTSGQTDLTIDAGYYKLAALGDRVWLDADADGVQDAGENGISGVTVKLIGAGTDGTFGTGDDTVLGTTTTDGTGIYGFTGLMPGQYEVQFVAPSGGYTQTAAGKGGDTSKDSNAGAGGYTAPVTLTSGQTDLTIDAGYYKLAALGDRVWLDADADGVQDAGENGISGVTVKLIGAGTDGTFGTGDDTVLGTTTTDGTGIYGFTGLMPGQYEVQFVAPSGGYTQTAAGKGGDTSKDSNAGAGGYTAPVTLLAGQTDLTIDAGYYKLAGLGDFVWCDTDADGIQDSGENGIGGVTVKLIGAGANGVFGDGDDTVLGTTTTNGAGGYSFTGLMPGQYEVQFVAPSGYFMSAANQGSNDAKDSDAGTGGYTAPVTLTAGEFDDTIDAGLFKKAALGDYVWCDTDADGIQDSNESGVAGVTVKLIGAGTDNTFGTTDDVTLSTTTTNSSGKYAFTNLNPGSYQVQFAAPSGKTFTQPFQGSNTSVDSNVNSSGRSDTVTLSSGETDNTIDAGVKTAGTPKVTIEKYVSVDDGCTWYDADSATGPTLLEGCGNDVKYKFVVTNTGNVTLTNLKLHDVNAVTGGTVDLNGSASGTDITIASLAAGASYSTTISKSWTAGQNTDTATVSGTYNGTPVSDTDDANYYGAVPSIKVDKQISFDGVHWYDIGVGTLDAPILQLNSSSGHNGCYDWNDCGGGYGYSDCYDYKSYGSNGYSDCWGSYGCNTSSTDVYYRVIVTNTSTGSISEKNVDVTDNTGLNFTFGSGHSQTTTLAAGQSITSNVVTEDAVTGTHRDTVTVKATATDSAGNTASVSATDIAQYTTVGKFVSDRDAQSSSYWGSHQSYWDGSGNCGSSDVLYSLPNHGKSGPSGAVGVLLGDTNGNGVKDSGETTLFVSVKAAQDLIGASSSSTDMRVLMMKQAIAAQLNIDAGLSAPGVMPGDTVGADLISEAVKWLTGASPFAYSDGSTGNVDTNHDGVLSVGNSNSYEYNTSSDKFTSTSLVSSKNAWLTDKSLGLSPTDIQVSGKDLMNALTAFNADQLVVSKDGLQVGWEGNGGSVSDIHLNTSANMWGVLKDQHVI
ncbi:MAG: SdrD B-like domain-containing protein [Acetobacteraceae bacterium]